MKKSKNGRPRGSFDKGKRLDALKAMQRGIETRADQLVSELREATLSAVASLDLDAAERHARWMNLAADILSECTQERIYEQRGIVAVRSFIADPDGYARRELAKPGLFEPGCIVHRCH